MRMLISKAYFFTDGIQVTALLYSVVDNGQDALDSIGCDTMDADATYDDIMKETVYV